MKTSYNDIFIRNQVLVNIPTEMEGRRLQTATATTILLMRLAYQKKCDEFEETMRKALDELKKEERFKDFDALSEEQSRMQSVLDRKKAHDGWDGEEDKRPVAPSEEELAKAREAEARKDDFDALSTELLGAYNAAREKHSLTETVIEAPKLTRAELEDIVGTVGTVGTMEIDGPRGAMQQPRMGFLALVADYFV